MQIASASENSTLRTERGATLVESAFFLVLTLVMIALLLELGLRIIAQFDVSQASREGARLASYFDDPGSEPAMTAILNKVNSQLYLKRLYSSVDMPAPQKIDVPSSLKYRDPVTLATKDCTWEVTVTVSIKMASLALMLRPFSQAPYELKRSTTMRSQAQKFCNWIQP